MNRIPILDAAAIRQKTRRIAYQIVESNYSETEISIIGVRENGFHFAQMLQAEIRLITGIPTILYGLGLDKQNPLSRAVSITPPLPDLAGKTILMVDDVANTGRTLYYALRPIMDSLPRKVQIAVLVDRQHKLFPISADYVGMSLSTTLQEHITVEIDSEGQASAYLM